MSKFLTVILMCLVVLTFGFSKVLAATYYIAPNENLDGTTNTLGNNANPGTSQSAPWKTFSSSWSKLSPGDTLVLLDGVYTEEMVPGKAGTPSAWITVKALNDGKAIIDGEFRHRAIWFQDWVIEDQYMNFEGLTVKNGVDIGITVSVNYVTFKRLVAYNDFHPWENAQVKELVHPIWTGFNHSVLFEDCFVAGQAMKLFKVFRAPINNTDPNAKGVTVRRCVVDWRWEGGHQNNNLWPWSGGLNVYHAGNSIFENIISFGSAADYGINMHGVETPDHTDPSSNNGYYGSISLNTAMQQNGTSINFGKLRPWPSFVNTDPYAVFYPGWNGGWGTGFSFGGYFSGLKLVDVVASGNADAGLSMSTYSGFPNGKNTPNTIQKSTFLNNGLDSKYSNNQTGIEIDGSGAFSISSDTYVEGDSRYQGAGADITKKYVDGTKTADLLWPWPMEQRIRDVAGYSVTNRIAKLKFPNNTYQVQAISDVPRPIMTSVSTLVDFGTIASNTTVTSFATLQNIGNGDLQVKSVSVYNEVAPVYTLSTGANSCPAAPFSLAAGSTCNLYLSFKPVSAVPYSARLLVYPSNMGSMAFPHIINVNGVGTGGASSPAPSPTIVTPVPTVNTPSPSPIVVPSPSSTPNSIYDVNLDGFLNLLDVLAILNYIFQ